MWIIAKCNTKMSTTLYIFGLCYYAVQFNIAMLISESNILKYIKKILQ